MNFLEFLEHIQAGNLSTIAMALQREPGLVNAQHERDGMTALHWATEHEQIEIVDLLISYGADVNGRNNEQETPLFSAVLKNLDIAVLLLEKGADIHVQNEFGRTPLHELAYYGRITESQFLLNYGANVHSHDANGDTPLHMAAESGMAQEVACLLANGAEVNSQSKNGYTPLHRAVSTSIMRHQLQWHLDTIEALIQHGANINLQTNDMKTPLELAKTNAHYPDIANLLIKHGAQ